jgi:hypothetical protein
MVSKDSQELWKQRQEDHEFKDSLSYMGPVLKTKPKINDNKNFLTVFPPFFTHIFKTGNI